MFEPESGYALGRNYNSAATSLGRAKDALPADLLNSERR